MGELIEIAASIMSGASRTVEVSAQNMANITSPGFKRRLEFSQVLAASEAALRPGVRPDSAFDFSPGKLTETGGAYDLALSGAGFFVVRTPDGAFVYTRDGQFRRDPDGRLLGLNGAALQADGADLVVRGSRFEVLADGVVLDDGQPVGRLDLVEILDRAQVSAVAGGFSAPEAALGALETPAVRQGMLEMSNVSTAAEMVAVMAALRRAESGQRVAMIYDDLIGRALSTFGQG